MNNQAQGHLPAKLQSEKATNIRVNFALGSVNDVGRKKFIA